MTPPAPAMPSNARPTGVTILAVLNFIGAGLLVVAGLIAFAGGAALATMLGPLGAMLGAAIGVFLIIFGVLAALAGWGLWSGKAWGWWIAFVLWVLSAVSNIVSLVQGEWSAIVSLAIAGFVIWYLTTPGVERWFGVNLKMPWTKAA